MAIRETLELDLSRALNQLDDLERQLDSLLQPIEIPIDSDQVTLTAQEFRKVQAAIEAGVEPAQAIARATGRVEFEADQAEDAIRGLSQALDISEDEASRMVVEFQEGRVEAARIEAAIREVSQALDLSEQDARELAQQMSRAAGETREMSTAGRTAGSGVGFLGGNLRGLITTLGAYVGAREFVNFARDSIAAASDLEESLSKTEVVFGDFSEEIITFSTTAPEALGLSNAAALETAATFGNLFVALGLTESAAADLAPEIVQLGADLASFNNIEVDEALVALRSGLVGEVEPLRRLGVAINAAVVEAKALELGLVDASGELSEAAKVQARYALILEQTTTAQGDFARTADGIANRQRTLAGNFENLQASIGEALLPAFEDLLEAGEDLVPMLETLTPLIGLLAENAVDAVAPLATATELLIGFLSPITDIANALGDVEGDAAASGFDRVREATLNTINPLRQFSDLVDDVGLALTAGFGTATLEDELEQIGRLLDAGVSPAGALEIALNSLADQGTVTSEVLAALVDVAGLTDDELRGFLARQLINADNLGTTEVEALRDLLDEVIDRLGIMSREDLVRGFFATQATDQTVEINEELQRTLDLNDDLRRASFDFGREGLFTATADELTLLAGAAEAAGLSIFDFIQDADGLPPRLQLIIDQLSGAQVAALEFSSATRGLALSVDLSDAVDEFELLIEATNEAGEEVPATMEEMLADLREQAEQFARLEAATTILEALGFDQLAEELRSQGPAAVTAAEAFVDDLEGALEAESLLEDGGRLGTEALEGLREALRTGDITPELLELVSQFTSGQIQGQVILAAIATGQLFGDELQDVLNSLDLSLQIQPEVIAVDPRRGPGGTSATLPGATSQTTNNVTNNFFTEPEPTTDTARVTQAVSSVISPNVTQ